MEKEQVDRSVEGRTLTGNSNNYPPAAGIGILNRVVSPGRISRSPSKLETWAPGLSAARRDTRCGGRATAFPPLLLGL